MPCCFPVGTDSKALVDSSAWEDITRQMWAAADENELPTTGSHITADFPMGKEAQDGLNVHVSCLNSVTTEFPVGGK